MYYNSLSKLSKVSIGINYHVQHDRTSIHRYVSLIIQAAAQATARDGNGRGLELVLSITLGLQELVEPSGGGCT